MSNRQSLLIIGAGGHARPVVDAAIRAGHEVAGIIDHRYAGQTELILGIPVIGGIDELNDFDQASTRCFIAIGDGEEREKLSLLVAEQGFEIVRLIHPTAIISEHTEIASGCFINAGAILNAGVALGTGTIINTGAIIDHETKIGAYCHIAPGVRIAGRVRIGDFSFIGIGASVIDKITIGDHVTVGAGSVIIRNIESQTKVAGVPGKPI